MLHENVYFSCILDKDGQLIFFPSYTGATLIHLLLVYIVGLLAITMCYT